jgi:hypothetical protein
MMAHGGAHVRNQQDQPSTWRGAVTVINLGSVGKLYTIPQQAHPFDTRSLKEPSIS